MCECEPMPVCVVDGARSHGMDDGTEKTEITTNSTNDIREDIGINARSSRR